ncbi:hypothetical protein GCM10027079_07040 [Sediminivirga luteola]|uniref:Ribosomally synthesized peptide with SipW-like signal peptide n=2 Tax=Sediminivirga luteola TaxID=1774748 RepID=A0A8J2U115_9MICO|nr:hypothetical protein GCM10011333_32200 [Sediminivirga luteola]
MSMSEHGDSTEWTVVRKKRRRDADTAAKHMRRRKLRAVLAAGLVLGVGAANTLASWTSESHLGATITTADFLIGGSVQYNNSTSGSWTSAGLDDEPFTINNLTTGAMQIGGTSTHRFWVRIDPASAADVTGARLYLDRIETPSPNGDHISFVVYRNTSTSITGCGATGNLNGTLVARGDSLNGEVEQVADGIQIASRTATNTRVCIRFTGEDGLLPNDTVDMTLHFTATDPA